MEFRCPSCGNVFDDSLGLCPACGSEVGKSADFPKYVDQLNVDYAADNTAFEAQPAAAPAPEQPVQQEIPYQANANAQANPNGAQSTEAPPSYQYQSYSYGSGQQQQPNYQQPGYQNPPNYQQTGYQPTGTPYVNMSSTPKSKIAAGLLGIFLGSLGIHNFYLGYTGKAVAQLLISILSCGTLAPVSAIWGLIEGILILTGSTITTDASGQPLGE